ncbi:DNA recombination protein RmuC [Thermomonas sp.]|uniref:DNA recombination protein RmuC n=1 Tax=Thermomonas sp. TaxID=1971895 RepID=UPI0024891FC6|nr:DNA recombination protein RmuC [Thermomonas sp.]MDI1252236.1 DNA recombination protein RmuC [Thermomonas sp.]
MARLREPLEQALRNEQRDGRSELRAQLDSMAKAQEQRIETFGLRLNDLTERTDQRLDVLRGSLSDDAHKGRQDAAIRQQQFADGLGAQLRELTQRNEQRIGEMRDTLEARLKELQADNAQKLELMRATVDEKLQTTLETRLGESFRLVSERLEQVQRGLGEMQSLATGVGDLKRVLGNVKDRGTFGETQLGALLEQILTIEQYATNIATVPDSNERVEFAIRLPGGPDGGTIWLPVDAKFPREDYERLLEAHENADAAAAQQSGMALERRIRDEAKKIRDKYVSPPHTTDFALLFLPTEGLYAEALRRPGLFDTLQREHKVTLVGPTTLLAVLNALQMGFRTLAIEERSSEVWQLLGAVKTEFGKFGAVLDATHKQLATVQNSIKSAGVRTRAIERKLRGVESLSSEASGRLLEIGDDELSDDE